MKERRVQRRVEGEKEDIAVVYCRRRLLGALPGATSNIEIISGGLGTEAALRWQILLF